jgi:hypothetical protein
LLVLSVQQASLFGVLRLVAGERPDVVAAAEPWECGEK